MASPAEIDRLMRAVMPEFLLPEELPPEPLGTVRAWLDEAIARKVQPNPNAMALATTTADGHPSARIVLCKELRVDPGYVVFFTNYDSRKGRELGSVPRAAAVFHWDSLERQVRLEGPTTLSPASESDAYHNSRPWPRRLAAAVSRQSEPLASRRDLVARMIDKAKELGIPLDQLERGGGEVKVPRPARWGGVRLWIAAVELWLGGPDRVHERARWERVLTPGGEGFVPGPWSCTRLHP